MGRRTNHGHHPDPIVAKVNRFLPLEPERSIEMNPAENVHRIHRLSRVVSRGADTRRLAPQMLVPDVADSPQQNGAEELDQHRRVATIPRRQRRRPLAHRR